MRAKKKGRAKSLGGVSKPKGRGKERSKSLGGLSKSYGDIFSEENPFAGVNFG